MLRKCFAWVIVALMLLGCTKTSPTPTLVATPATTEPPANNIILHYHERPPYMATSGASVEGLTATPAGEAFAQAGIVFEWQQTPSNRQLEVIKSNGGRDCGLGWFKNPEREEFARFTVPLYQDKAMVALARADNAAIISGKTVGAVLQDAALTLLVKDGYSYGAFIDGAIAEYAPQKTSTTVENVNMIQMIHSQRADYFFIAPEETEPLIKAAELAVEDFKLVEFSDMPVGNKRYIMCSLNVEPGVIEQLNAALRTLVDVPEN